MINQEIKIEFFDETENKWVALLSSYNEEMPFVEYRPYIAIQLQIQDQIITSAILTIGNPYANFAKNLWGVKLKISIGYSQLIQSGNTWKLDISKITPIFIGQISSQAPYQTDSGKGTDQNVVVPLMLHNFMGTDNVDFKENTTIGNVLKGIFPNSQFEYNPQELETQIIKKPFIYNNTMNWTQIVKLFEANEGVYLEHNNMDLIVVTTKEQATKNIQDDSSVRMGVIYNQPTNKAVSGYCNTFIKTKNAVIGLNNSLNLELAIVCTNLIGKQYAMIENVGENINIYYSSSTNEAPSKYKILAQHIVFSTFGDASHRVSLLGELS